MQEIAKAEGERDELRERLGIHSEEYKAKNQEVKNLTSERKADIWEWKVTMAKVKKEMWPILRSLTTDSMYSMYVALLQIVCIVCM